MFYNSIENICVIINKVARKRIYRVAGTPYFCPFALFCLIHQREAQRLTIIDLYENTNSRRSFGEYYKFVIKLLQVNAR